jgi:hypothetical protein
LEGFVNTRDVLFMMMESSSEDDISKVEFIKVLNMGVERSSGYGPSKDRIECKVHFRDGQVGILFERSPDNWEWYDGGVAAPSEVYNGA